MTEESVGDGCKKSVVKADAYLTFKRMGGSKGEDKGRRESLI